MLSTLRGELVARDARCPAGREAELVSRLRSKVCQSNDAEVAEQDGSCKVHGVRKATPVASAWVGK
jgi:hypothetical protein